MSNPRLYQLNTQTGTLVLTGANIGLNVVHNAVFSSNVGIGTTNPTNKLHIEGGNAVGQIKVSGLEADIQMYSSGANSTWRLLGSTANSIKLFRIYDNDNGANRFIITSSGEVGIGTTQPQAKLGVQGNSGAGVDGGVLLDLFGGTISAANDGVGISFTRTGSQLGYIQAARENSSNEASILRFATQTSGGSHPERMRIDSSGNVAIGTTNATQKLTVNGALESLVDRAGGVDEGGQLILRSPAGGNTRWNIDNFQNKLRIFREDDSDTSNGAAVVHIVNGGSVGIGTSSPSYPLSVSSSGHGQYSQHRQSSSNGTGQEMYYMFNNASGTPVNYASILTEIVSNVAGSHSGALELRTATSGSLTGKLRVSDQGHVIIPNQPAFSVYQTGSAVKNGTITYNQTILNRGSHMNNSNGRFTAPVAGAYYFSFMCFQEAGTSGVITGRFDINGSTSIVRFYQEDDYIGYGPHVTLAAVLSLNAGDYVTVNITAGQTHGNEDCFFSGYLIG